MLCFVTWKWRPPKGYRSEFGPDTVNVLRRMIARHYQAPHRFCCVTHETEGLDKEVEVIKPWDDYSKLPPPTGLARNPSCYRRLRMFHPDIGKWFGSRFASLDLDLVITADIRPVFDRPEDFVIWGDTNPRTYYNGSLILMNAGARPQVWTQFDPVKTPQLAKAAGHFGSDQGAVSYLLGPGETKWTTADGVYSYQNHLRPNAHVLPKNARIVVMHGHDDPWAPAARHIPWITEHYR